MLSAMARRSGRSPGTTESRHGKQEAEEGADGSVGTDGGQQGSQGVQPDEAYAPQEAEGLAACGWDGARQGFPYVSRAHSRQVRIGTRCRRE
jgi:hypothetical protein